MLESTGGYIFERNFECVAPFGRHILFGSTRGPGDPFAPRKLMQKSQSLTGFYLPVYLAWPDLIHQGMEFLVKATADKKLKRSIAEVLPLSKMAEGHRPLEDREVEGTILLDTTAL